MSRTPSISRSSFGSLVAALVAALLLGTGLLAVMAPSAFSHASGSYARHVSARHKRTREKPSRRRRSASRPGPVSGLRLLAQTSGSVRIGWRRAHHGSIAIEGYRIKRDGLVEGQTHGLSYAVRVGPGTHSITVTAVDLDGHLGPASSPLTVTVPVPPGYAGTAPRTPSTPRTSHTAPPIPPTTHTPSSPLPPPSSPGGLKAQTVADESAVVEWEASTPASGEAVSYRVFRDGTTVGQTQSLSMTLEHLAPETGYTITVAAVGSQGATSEPSAPLEIETQPPPQTHGTAQAALLATTDVSFDDLQAHYQQIGVLYPTYFECGKGGVVTGSDDPLVTGWAQERGIEVMPRLNCQNPLDEEQVLNEPKTAGQKMIETLASLCETYGYKGIQIDFEGAPPAERNPFTAFITALSEKLHEQGDKLSTIVTAKTENVKTGRAAMYDDAALSGPSDYLFVLDWGLHWTTSKPGGIDELPWFKKVAEYVATMPNKSKFVLGMPMYGIDWANEGGPSNPGATLEYGEIMALANEFGATPEWAEPAADPHFSYVDAGVPHSVWYTDKQSLEVRVSLARSLGLGVGLWHLGNEDQSIWEIPGLGG
jgi:spore germination protein YaaH